MPWYVDATRGAGRARRDRTRRVRRLPAGPRGADDEPRDRPQLDVDLSYDADAEVLRCVVDMGTTLTAANTKRLTVKGRRGSRVMWVASERDARQSLPVEPGDVLELDWSAPDAYVLWVGPAEQSQMVFGELDAATTSEDA